MLKITNLSKKFKKRMILDDIDLELAFGNIYGFIGANGRGNRYFLRRSAAF